VCFSRQRLALANWLQKRVKKNKGDDMTALTEKFDRALLYTSAVHGGHKRKGTDIPYIAHLLAVAATVLEYDGSEDMAIAALLHDAVEDQGGLPRLDDIRSRFGDRVADIVFACTDSAETGRPKAEWRIRKERYIAHLDDVDKEALLVSLADKVHNARSILRDSRREGIGALVWDRFNRPKPDTCWYYSALAEAFQRRLPGQLSDELAHLARALAD
jgi:(p)ppGpp synthase/HD superfamily hydrolase